jgi:hypothetical protein
VKKERTQTAMWQIVIFSSHKIDHYNLLKTKNFAFPTIQPQPETRKYRLTT